MCEILEELCRCVCVCICVCVRSHVHVHTCLCFSLDRLDLAHNVPLSWRADNQIKTASSFLTVCYSPSLLEYHTIPEGFLMFGVNVTDTIGGCSGWIDFTIWLCENRLLSLPSLASISPYQCLRFQSLSQLTVSWNALGV